MKPNPKNFEAYIDPDGGEWIRMKSGKYKDITWRPTDIQMAEDDSGQVTFQVEYLGNMPEENDAAHFEKITGAIMLDIFARMAYENGNSNSS